MNGYPDFDKIEQDLRQAFADAKKYTSSNYGDRRSQATNRLAMAEIVKTLLKLEKRRVALETQENIKRPRASRSLQQG